jgi:hypothetical protein
MKALIIIVAAIACLTGCSVHVNPDGSKDVTVDAPSALRAMEILAEK